MFDDSSDEKWTYPPHTKAKHDILDRYLGGWFGKLSKFPRVLFFDGFAGRGRYVDGSEGSPLIALRKVLGHPVLDTTSCQFEFLFVEKDPTNLGILKQVVADLEAETGRFPSNVTVRLEPGTFEDHANALAQQARDSSPTFAFIDPFGYSGVPMDTIRRLTAYNTTEVFVNLMVDHLGRFVRRDGQEAAVSELFGLPADEVMADFDADDDIRHEHLRDKYINQLRKVAKFPFTTSFGMKTDGGHLGYYLIHGTRHPEGIRLMKQAMWNVDPTGGAMFSDRHAHQDSLFVLGPNLVPLKEGLLRDFAGRSNVCLEDLRAHVMLGPSPYRETHVPDAVKELENERYVQVKRTSRKYSDVYVSFPA